MTLGTPLTAKAKDGVLKAIGLSRVSTPGQDIASNDSQHAAAETWLQGEYKGRIEFVGLASRSADGSLNVR